MPFKIKKIIAREILDSRGNPTVECDVFTTTAMGRASVPSGASTGSFEAVEIRDGGTRYLGRGVRAAVRHVNTTLAKKVKGMDCRDQENIDQTMIRADGKNDKSLLGANAILAVSMATARAAAAESKKPLYRYLAASVIKNRNLSIPVPFCNVINGGKHAGSSLKIQEFMLVPAKFRTFAEAIAAVSETYHQLKKIIAKKHGVQSTNVGDEGGFAPALTTAEEALNLLESAVSIAGYKNKMFFAIDAAASEFYDADTGRYPLHKPFSSGELADYYLHLASSYDLVSLEDPFEESDFEAFARLTKRASIQIVGDDLLVTNMGRIRRAVEAQSCNALLLKVNQIGTLTEAIDAAKFAKSVKWNVMVSHRSGETEDPFIADLAVALGTGQLKAGAPARSERTAKYNQLLRLEEMGIKFARL